MPVTDSPAMEAFRENVRRLIDEGTITISELARRTGMSRSGLSELISGADPTCSIPRAERIAHALGVPLKNLL